MSFPKMKRLTLFILLLFLSTVILPVSLEWMFKGGGGEEESIITLLENAHVAIKKAEEKGRTFGLDKAKELYEQAKEAFLIGDIEKATVLATQAKEAADKAKSNPKVLVPFIILVLIGVLVTFLASRGRGEALTRRREPLWDHFKITK